MIIYTSEEKTTMLNTLIQRICNNEFDVIQCTDVQIKFKTQNGNTFVVGLNVHQFGQILAKNNINNIENESIEPSVEMQELFKNYLKDNYTKEISFYDID